MYRTTQRLLPIRRNLTPRVGSHKALSSSSKSASSVPVGAVITAGGVTATVGGLLGYASWSDENRKSIDDSVPGFQYLTDAVLGVKQPPPPVQPKAPTPSAALSKKPEKREEKTKPEESVKVAEPVKTTEEKTQKTETVITEKKEENIQASTETPSETPTDAKEELKVPIVTVTSVALTSAMQEANKSVTVALSAAEEAAEAIQKQLQVALQNIGQGSITESIQAAIGAAVTSAEESLDSAQSSLTKLSDSIKLSKAGGDEPSDSVCLAEQTASELVPAVDRIKTVMSESLNRILTLETLNEALLEAREKLSSELHELLPEVSNVEAERQLQLMLGQAYIKIATLQKNISQKQKSLDELREMGGEEGGRTAESDLQYELDKLRRQLSLQHKSDLSRQKDELEAEVRGQLKRQAAAHSDHLTDMLTKKENEVKKVWQTKLFDEIIKEKDRHLKEIAGVRGKVIGLKVAIDSRADAEVEAFSARRLWLACNSLKNSLRLGKADASDFSGQMEPLSKHLSAISVAGLRDEFVKTVLSTLEADEVCTQRGVYTENALRHRFTRVAKIAKRVALVPENGGSLLRYLLSYMQSLLIIPSSPPGAEAMLFDTPVDIDSLNTFDLIDRARVSLEADDLTSCVRWLNQLTGESRNVSRDWVVEARRTLAAKQAADALMAHAATVTARAV